MPPAACSPGDAACVRPASCEFPLEFVKSLFLSAKRTRQPLSIALDLFARVEECGKTRQDSGRAEALQ